MCYILYPSDISYFTLHRLNLKGERDRDFLSYKKHNDTKTKKKEKSN